MNPNVSSRRTLAFTLVELLTVIAIIGILAALLMPVLNKTEGRAKRIVCIDDLGQVGLAFHTFSGDHNGKFQTAISTNDGGSLEYVESGFASGDVFYTTFRNFQPLSGELVQPQLLICPTDRQRTAATNFASLQNENLSYFVGVEGTFDKPASILAGDRNLTTNAFDQPTILGFGQESDLGWTWEMHQFKGNLVFADGHVEQWNNASLAMGESASPFNQSLFMPSIVPEASLPFATGGSGSGGGVGAGSGSSGSSGASDSGSGNSGSASSFPTASSSGAAGPSAGNSGATIASGSSQNDQSPAAQPAQPSSDYSSGQQLSKTEATNEANASESPLIAARPVIQASGSTTDVVVAVQDPNVDMAPFDRHMTKVLQNDLLWLYLLLCLLVLLYLLYRMRKRKRERQARLAKQYADWVESES